MLISLVDMSHEGGSFIWLLGGHWRFLKKSWMTGSSLISWMFFYPREDTLKVSCWYLYGKCVKKGGYLENVDGFWPETWRTGSSLMSWMIFSSPKKDTLKVSCWYLYGMCVRKGGQEWGYLEDVEGYWPETWRKGSSLMSWMTLVDLKDHILKVSGQYAR